MSRPSQYVFVVVLVAVNLGFAGCGTIYDDMYSPRRSRFVPDKPKPKSTSEAGPIPPGDTTPSNPVPSTAPSVLPPPSPPPAVPSTVPGLEPVPPAPAPLPGAAPAPPAEPGAPPAPDGAAPPVPPAPGTP